MIAWEHQGSFFCVGRAGAAVFQVQSGVGDNFCATMTMVADCNPILQSAKSMDEAKRFCEWVARAYNL
jgi:hypothetical protein